ncbi:DUF6985 domain-containing protein [Aureivirga marina]|uniref:DUF6985 domain-containing protein n=1 Tax=Aureivirga marina TaxID=1182451 RepID=UPI0018CB610B|nr:hypothetical protein [Aureivirga marina]
MSVKVDYYKECLDVMTLEGKQLEFEEMEMEMKVDFSKYNSEKNLRQIKWSDWIHLFIADSFTIDLSEKIPSDTTLKTLQYILENTDQIIENICKKICKNQELIDIYDANSPEFSYGIPTYENHKLATRHFMITSLHISEKEKDGLKYFSFKGECSWDYEHGIGCVLHKDEVLKLGSWDVG